MTGALLRSLCSTEWSFFGFFQSEVSSQGGMQLPRLPLALFYGHLCSHSFAASGIWLWENSRRASSGSDETQEYKLASKTLFWRRDTHKKAVDISTVNRTLSRSNLIIFLAWLVWSANTCHSYRFSFIIIIIPASNYRKSVHKNTGWEPEQAFLTELVLNRFKELFYIIWRHWSLAQIADLVSGFLPSPLRKATGGDCFIVSIITVSFHGLSIQKHS